MVEEKITEKVSFEIRVKQWKSDEGWQQCVAS